METKESGLGLLGRPDHLELSDQIKNVKHEALVRLQ